MTNETDSPKFDFRVSADAAPPSSAKGAGGRTAVVVGTVFLVGAVMIVVQLLTSGQIREAMKRPEPAAPQGELPLEKQKALAAQLEARNLHREAAEAYLNAARRENLPAEQLAKTYYHIGTLWQKADEPARAITSYLRSEAVHKDEGGELAGLVRERLSECFRTLGLHDEWQYELASRVDLDPSKTEGGKQVVAEIGAEKITMADLDALIRRDVDLQVRMMGAGASPEQLQQLRDQYMKRFSDTKAKQAKLAQLIQERIIYREAIEQGLEKDEDVRKQVRSLTRQVVISVMVRRELAKKAQLTDRDYMLYYRANQDRYRESGKAKIQHIVVAEEKLAKGILDELKKKDGASFADLAAKHSIDEETKKSGGKVETWVHEQSRDDKAFVTGVSGNQQMLTAVFAAAKGALVDQPIKSSKGWHVIQVLDKAEPRQKPYDEVRDEVTQAAGREKAEEIQQQLIERLFKKHRVRLLGDPSPAATQKK